MIFFFGWGRRKPKDLGRVVPAQCPNCRNKAYFKLVQSQEYLSFFFIPMTASSKYFLICEICSRGVDLSDRYLPKTQRLIAATNQFLGGSITQDKYENLVCEEDLFGEIARENNHPDIAKVCPSCGKGYDQSWKICVQCSVSLKDKNASLAEIPHEQKI